MQAERQEEREVITLTLTFHPNQAEEHEREEEMEVMIKWTIVLSLAALAVTYICGYLLELRHIHTS